MENIDDYPIITIDGPAGSGKGTISQCIANRLGWNILDSGALYRLVAFAALKRNIPFTDKANDLQLTQVAKELDVLFKAMPNNTIKIILEGEDVSLSIRTEDCGNAASQVAAKEPVRAALLQRQREFLQPPGLVADGRDMGTVVFPMAKVKIFLTASAEVRGLRRLNQLKENGISANLHGLIRDIEERDARDSQREVAPLIPAHDATIIDTGTMSIDEVVSEVMDRINKAY